MSLTLHPGHYSTAEQAAAYVAATASGVLSVLGSIALIHYIVRRQCAILEQKATRRQQKSSTGHRDSSTTTKTRRRRRIIPSLMTELRMVLFQAMTHLGAGLLFCVFDFCIPREFPDYWLNFGTTASCDFQGWMQQTTQVSAAGYQVALAAYYLWTMSWGLTDTKRYERWIHALALGFPSATATISLALGAFNPSSTMGCFYSDSPLGCHQGGTSCDRGDFAYLLVWFFTGLPLLVCFGFLIYVLFALRAYIRRLFELVDEMGVPKDTAPVSISAPTDDSAESPHTTRNPSQHGPSNNKKEDPRLASMLRFVAVEKDTVYTLTLYVAAFFLTNCMLFVCVIYDQAAISPPFAIRFLHNLLWPSQGFFNFLIFFRPRIAHLRKSTQQQHEHDNGHPTMNYWEAGYRVIFLHHPSNHSYRAPSQHGNNSTHSHENHSENHYSSHAVGTSSVGPTTDQTASWTHTDVNEARQLAREMSSRRMLASPANNHRTSTRRVSFGSRPSTAAKQPPRQQSSPVSIPPASKDAAVTVAATTVFVEELGEIEDGESVSEISVGESKKSTSEHSVSYLDASKDTYHHTTSHDSQHSSTSWSKMDLSQRNTDTNHQTTINGSQHSATSWSKMDLSQEIARRSTSNIIRGGTAVLETPFCILKTTADDSTVESFEGDTMSETPERRTPRRASTGSSETERKFARRSSTESGLHSISESHDDDHDNVQEAKGNSANGIPHHVNTSHRNAGNGTSIPSGVHSSGDQPLRTSLDSSSLGSWSSFSNADILWGGETMEKEITFEEVGPSSMPSRGDSTGGILPTLPHAGLDSVMEAEFEDSKGDLSSSDIVGIEQAPPRPSLRGRGQGEEYSSWSQLSSTYMFSLPPPDMAAIMFHVSKGDRPTEESPCEPRPASSTGVVRSTHVHSLDAVSENEYEDSTHVSYFEEDGMEVADGLGQ